MPPWLEILLDVMAFVIVGVFVTTAVAQTLHERCRRVTQMKRDG